MRTFNPGDARIARALVLVLLSTFIQSIVFPVIAPVSISKALAVDANDFPTGLGTVYQYLAESYTSGSTTWPEARGGAAATITNNATKVTNTAGTLGASKSVVAVNGLTTTYLEFPTTIGPGGGSNYTLLYVARYAPPNGSVTQAGNYCDTVSHSAAAAGKARILSSLSGNWLSGFWACAAGVAYHEGWLTQNSASVTELSASNGNNWLLGSDCGYTLASSSTCKGRFRAFGTDRTTTASVSTATHQVVVNGGAFPEKSDFQIAEVISYPSILATGDLVKVETYLARKYGITLASSSASKLGIHRSSVGTNLNEPLSVQPQIAIQDTNGQTVTTDNSTIITATVTGLNGRVIGTATADVVQGIATFDNLGIDGLPNNSYTITYSSNLGLTSTSETRTFTRGGGSETDTALLLSGSTQYAEKSDVTGSPYDITGDITLQAWVYPTSDCTGDQGVIAKLNSYMLYCGSSGYWKYVFDADGLSWSGSTSGVKVRKNEWHHIAYVKSGTTLKIYVDGNVILTTTSNVPATVGVNNDPFQIGRFGTSSYFQGEIDEVRVYRSARTQSQIESDMHNYGPISEATLVAYYDFNEGTGTTLFNRSQNASSLSDMSIVGSPTWTDIKSVDATTLSAYTMVRFDRSYLTSSGGWRVPEGVTRVRALVVAGGGGGGSDEGGGGGAGGFIDTTTLAFTPNAVARVTVGAGGNGAEGNDLFDAENGQNSVLDSLIAVGGGGGGSSVNTNLDVRNGRAGGSGGGGAGEGLSNRAGGAATANQGSVGGIGISSGSGGGGGGATEAGNIDGNGQGGDGRVSDITGTSVIYAGGGGGGNGNTGSTSYVGGDGGGGRGGSSNITAVNGTAGLGGGGGGAGSLATVNSSVAFSGADGGSGVIVIRYITASRPIFTQPQNDTTTAGLTDTITVSANPISPLTRNYQWQVSTDTGTTWVNASSGSGITSNTYTTPILETTTSGSRFQYRVVVTDSDTAGLFIVDTSVAVFIVVNARITFTGSYTVQKYGDTHQDTFTVLNGTGNKTFTYSPNNRTGITWSLPTTNTAVLTIGTTLFVGTYLETITATDTRGAQTSLTLSIVVTKADTITVTAIARSETYTGSTLSFSPTFTVAGLKNSDTITAASISWNYNGVENSGTLYAIQSTRPTNAGNYIITPVTPTSLIDSYTAVTVVPASLVVNRATRTISITPPASPIKFGDTRTVTATPSAGSGDGTITFATSTSDSCTISNATVTAVRSSGTCSLTATISRGNNFETATSTAGTTTLTKADTLTVTIDEMAPLTYTGAQIGITPTVTVSGLKLNNAVGATPATIQYAALDTPQTFSGTKPTDADTYTVRASGLTLTSGSLNDYQGVTYVDAALRVNRALQSQLMLAEYGATFGEPFRVIVFGGSGTGATSVTTTSGTATGCSISGENLTTSSVGTCSVTAVKARDKNYETATVTISVYFLQYVIQQPAPVASPGPGIALSGVTSVTLDPNQAPTISGISISSGRVGDTVTITGSGFTASALQSVKFWRNIFAAIQGTPTNTQIVVLVPAGATTGKILVTTANGSAITEGSFTILP
jgi:hypothetical protein